MEEKQKKEKAGNRINQFIIECMFNKYFEEEKTSVKQQEIASSAAFQAASSQ